MNVKKVNKINTIFSEDTTTESLITTTIKQPTKALLPSLQRLNKVITKNSFPDKTGDIASFFSSTAKISCITFIGQNNSKEAKKRYISQRLGRNKQNIFHLRSSLLPNITINADFIAYNNGELNHKFNKSTFGQSKDIVTVKNNKFVPFNDRLSKKFLAEEFIKSNQKTIAYPNLTNGRENFINYKNPDAVEGTLGSPEKNGTIDVFGTVTALTNTSPSDIKILGIRGNYGVIDQELLQYDASRGSSIVDNKYELKQLKHVFFEDSQEMHMSSPINNVKKSVIDSGALGAGISGSGPSIFALSKGEKTAKLVGEVMAEIYNKTDIDYDIHVSKINQQGIKILK